MENSGSNFWLLMAGVARRRGMILVIVLVATIGAAVVSLLLPKWYESSSLVLPTESDALPLGHLSGRSNLPAISGLITLSGVVTPADVYARMLRSRTIAETIIEQFDLRAIYEAGTFTDAYLALMSHSHFDVTDEGLLLIRVEDKDPQRAADMNNAYIEQLRFVIKDLLTTRARQKREFIEDRLIELKGMLDSARLVLERFQKENRTLDIPQQTRLAMEQAIRLKIDLARVAVKLDMELQVRGDQNLIVKQLQREHDAITRQLSVLEEGGGDSSFFSVPLAAMPGLTGRFEDLYGQVRVSESLHKILLEQLEQAKIQESEQTPSFSILDRAEKPEFRSRPRRSIIVGVSFGLSLMFALFLALILNYIEQLASSNNEDSKRAIFVIESFFGWIPGIKHASRKGRADSASDRAPTTRERVD